MGATTSRGRSGRGGVPTVLPPPADVRQLGLPLDAPERMRHDPLPGVVHVAGWLDVERQRSLVADFRRWAVPPAGLRHPRMPSGHLMSVQSVCLGWHWQPYGYSRTADDTDGAPVEPLPDDLAALARAAVDETLGGGAAPPERAPARRTAMGCGAAAPTVFRPSVPFEPDAAIVNLYAPGARLGLHQDGEEPSAAPVVTISLGDSCVFRLAGVERRTAPFTDVVLRSGDLLVFGGPNRRIHHGVPRVFDGSGPHDLGLPPGRLSITVRETGL